MQVKITKGRVKIARGYLAEGEIAHVDDSVGKELIERGVAVRVQRRTSVALNLHMTADDEAAEAHTDDQ